MQQWDVPRCLLSYVLLLLDNSAVLCLQYIIVGSANINQRSMGGDRDTELAVGAFQPQYTTHSMHGKTPRGQVSRQPL